MGTALASRLIPKDNFLPQNQGALLAAIMKGIAAAGTNVGSRGLVYGGVRLHPLSLSNSILTPPFFLRPLPRSSSRLPSTTRSPLARLPSPSRPHGGTPSGTSSSRPRSTTTPRPPRSPLRSRRVRPLPTLSEPSLLLVHTRTRPPSQRVLDLPLYVPLPLSLPYLQTLTIMTRTLALRRPHRVVLGQRQLQQGTSPCPPSPVPYSLHPPSTAPCYQAEDRP